MSCSAKYCENIWSPGAHVHVGGRCEHAIEVKEGCVELVPVHELNGSAPEARWRVESAPAWIWSRQEGLWPKKFGSDS